MREIWGLDLETSGSELEFSATIQLGLYYNDWMYCRTAGGWKWVENEVDADPTLSKAYWHPQAAEIHKLTKRQVDSAPRYWDVEAEAVASVKRLTFATTRRSERWVVGWNVKGFDMPFVHRDFPELYELFAFRSIDLNAVTAAVVGKIGPEGGVPWTYRSLKTYVKARAEELAKEALVGADKVGMLDFKAHNAGFDATTAVYSFEVLQRLIRA